ncbi:MAG: cell division protein FtsQ/DivIB [Robiginitomaculum sp.]
MAPLSRRKPKPRRKAPTPRGGAVRVSPLKPGLRHARNWAAGQVRAASYTRKGAMRMTMMAVATTIAVLTMGLWLGGFLPDARQAGSDFTRGRLVAMGFVVQRIDVVGEGRIFEDEVRAALGINVNDYLFGADMREAQINVQKLSWVDDAMVRRLWPNRIVVHIIERQPVALWQQNGVVRVVDGEGLVIEAALASDFAKLPLLVGPNAAAHSQSIYDALAQSPAVSKRLGAIIRVGDRRWDIALKDNGPRLKLPVDNVRAALTRIEEMQRSHRILDLDLETIDLRVSGRAILRPREARNIIRRSAA